MNNRKVQRNSEQYWSQKIESEMQNTKRIHEQQRKKRRIRSSMFWGDKREKKFAVKSGRGTSIAKK